MLAAWIDGALRDERGATAIEYAIIGCVLVISMLLGLGPMKDEVGALYQSAAEAVAAIPASR